MAEVSSEIEESSAIFKRGPKVLLFTPCPVTALRDAQKSHYMRFRAAELGIPVQNARKHLAGSFRREL